MRSRFASVPLALLLVFPAHASAELTQILMGSTLAVPEAARPLLEAIRRHMAQEK